MRLIRDPSGSPRKQFNLTGFGTGAPEPEALTAKSEHASASPRAWALNHKSSKYIATEYDLFFFVFTFYNPVYSKCMTVEFTHSDAKYVFVMLYIMEMPKSAKF